MDSAEILIKFKGETSGVEKSINNVTSGMNNLTKSITLGNLAAKAIAQGFSLIRQNLDSAITRFDIMNNFPKVMSNLGIGSQEAQKSIDTLSKKLQGLPTALDSAAQSVQRLTSKNGDIKKSTDMFLAMNNAILAGGAPANLQAAAVEQLSQAYAKGKPDMMEWRSMLNAMPAQLKQVATAMGYIDADALGEALRDGGESMDAFMDTIMQLNKKGVNGFQNFEQQARNATGGISTSVTNMKTAITRGITSMLDSLNKSLKKAGYGGIANVVSKAGKKIEGVLKNIGKVIEKIPLDKMYKMLKKLIPVFASVVVGITAYNNALKVAKGINIAKNVIQAVGAMTNLSKATKLAGDAQKIYNVIMNANPYAIAITAVAALTAGLIALANTTKKTKTETQKLQSEIDKTKNNLNDYAESVNDLQRERNNALKESAGELGHYQDLWQELKNITDENGKVNEGYEKRAKTIAGILSDALGEEIQLTDNQIQNYSELNETIKKLIETKKAEALMNAYEGEYNNAIKGQKALWEDYTNAVKQAEDAEKAFKKEAKNIAKASGVNMSTKDVEAYFKGLMSYQEIAKKYSSTRALELSRFKNTIKDEKKALDDANNSLEKAGKLYGENQKSINDYENAVGEFSQGHYDAVEKIFNQQVTFSNNMKTINKKTYDEQVKANNKAYKQQEKTFETHLKYMQEHTDKYSQEEIDAFKLQKDQELEILKKKRDEANSTLKAQYDNSKNITKDGMKKTLDELNGGLANQLKSLTGKKVEFQKAGNGLIQAVVDGEKIGQPTTEQQMRTIVDGSIREIRKKNLDAKSAGKFLIDGLNYGLTDQAGSLFANAASIASNVISTMKKQMKIKSPSRETKAMGIYLLEGLGLGLKEEEDSLLRQVEGVGKDILSAFDKQLNDDINLGDIATNITATGKFNPYVNNLSASTLGNMQVGNTQPIVNVYAGFEIDPIGQVVSKIKTYSGGAKNDYNYGYGG